jgi:hypothetical protein
MPPTVKHIFGGRRAAAGAELDAALAQMIEHGDLLGDPRRMIHLCRDVDDGAADVDALGARRDEAQVHLGARLVRVVGEEVMLRRPVVLEAGCVDRQRHVETAQEARVLILVIRHMHLREDSELHDASPLAGFERWFRADERGFL